jgi:hypothetical protein
MIPVHRGHRNRPAQRGNRFAAVSAGGGIAAGISGMMHQAEDGGGRGIGVGREQTWQVKQCAE